MHREMNELVSIITPVFNAEKYIRQTLDSVLRQTYEKWEMIIVDDKSDDNSVGIIGEYARTDIRIKLIKLSCNSGVAAARNAAIEVAEGRYIAFLDSDDIWLDNKLEKQIKFMSLKNAVLTYTAYKKMDINGLIGSGTVWVKDSLTYNELLYNTLGCLTVIYDQKIVGKMFMTAVGHEDFALWLNILKKGYIAYGLNEPLAVYRVNNKSVSGNKFKAAGFVWNVYRNVEQLSLLKSCICFAKYAFLSYKKFRIG